MVRIKRYTDSDRQLWDSFVEISKNGTFMFKRDYMEYHKDRFEDCSLLFFSDRNRLMALLPANRDGDTLCSHQGLTFGGFVLTADTSVNDVMLLFDALTEWLGENGFSSLFYKQMPSIYHRCPAEEDSYALWRHKAEVEVCNIATSIPLHTPLLPKVEKCRRRRLNQSKQYGFVLVDDAPLSEFWPILEESLYAHHRAKPTHTLGEMELLRQRFPDNIRCMTARRPDGSTAGGVVLYCTDEVVHVQYGHASLSGYREHVMEYMYFALLERYSRDGHTLFLDFGTSNENSGRFLNTSLVSQKEGFGGRSIAYRQYRIRVDRWHSRQQEEEFTITEYSIEHKNEWDSFVENSKNGTFLHKRDYMEYHSNRFRDNSLMFYSGKRLYAVLPANICDGTLYSHQGLTYGGIILDSKATAAKVTRLFEALNAYLAYHDIRLVQYKPSPFSYHRQPAEEDLYAIFNVCNARLRSRSIGSLIDLENRLPLRQNRRTALNHAHFKEVYVCESTDMEAFWRILEDNLMATYNTRPVHSLEEISHLKKLFPECIRLFMAYTKDRRPIAGIVIYEMKNLIHTQYISANNEGKQCGAVDAIIEHLFTRYSTIKYFDLGTSTVNGGRAINESLIFQKEGFGGRGVCYDTYEWEIKCD